MSSSKVQNLTELAEAPASGDLLIVWDVSENDADGAAGKPKKITSANAHAGYQPLDALLTALAALVTAANKIAYFTGVDTVSLADLTAFARTLLDDSDAATARATLGLGSISIQDASNVTISGGSVTGITDVAVADGGTGASTAAGARTNLGLVIGTDVQAYSAVLAALTSAFVAASASGPASLLFHEDTDNGSNKVTVTAPASLSGDVTATLPSSTGTIITSTDNPSDLTPDVCVTETGTSFTLSSTHDGKTVRCTNASQVTVTIPTDGSDDLRDGYRTLILAEGAGGVTLSTSGITLGGSSPNKTIAQNEAIYTEKTASANTWLIIGGTAT